MAEAAAVGPGAIQPSPNLQASLQRAARYASEQGHGAITIEHLLLALTEDPDALVVLATSGVELGRLRHDLADLLARSGAVAEPTGGGQITASNDLRKVFDYASAAARQSQRGVLDGAMLLAAIIGDGRSAGAQFLRGQGVTAEAILKSLDLIARSVARRSGNIPPAGVNAATGPGASAKAGATPTVTTAASATGGASPDPQPTTGPRGASEAERTGAHRRPSATEGDTGGAEPRSHRPGDHADLARLPAAASGPAPTARKRVAGERELARLDGIAGHSERAEQVGSPSVGAARAPAVAPSRQHAGPAGEPFGASDQDGVRAGPVGGGARPVAAAAPPVPNESLPDGPPASLSPVRRPQPAPHGQRVSTVRPPERGAQAAGGGAPRPPHRQFQAAPGQPQPGAHAHEGFEQRPPQDMARRGAPPAYPVEQKGERTAGPPIERPGGFTRRPHDPVHAPVDPPARGIQPEAVATVPRSAPVRQPVSAPAPAPAASGPQRAPDEFQSGLLVENVPRRMRVGVPAKVEARLSREDLPGLMDGLRGAGEIQQHEVFVTRVMAVRLKAPDGGFDIESTSPEMQWVDGGPASRLVDEHASWRWTVTPTARGWRPLVLVITGLAVGPDGLAAERRVPDQEIEVQVRVNYVAEARRIGGWLVVAVLGGVLGAFGERLVALFGCCG
ncbi:MAG: hypothetical protein GC150_09755 [Rhizobiales bacterium]|nr:hypothetical protein [Hyphomicrobiales bacterium]